MENNEIYTRLNGLFRSVLDNDEIVVSPQMTANDVENWDSLSHVRLILSIERSFGVKFSAYEVNKLKNVGQLAALIEQKLGAKA